jgi:hypothetical protein
MQPKTLSACVWRNQRSAHPAKRHDDGFGSREAAGVQFGRNMNRQLKGV